MRERGTLQAARCAAVLLSGVLLLLGSSTPSWADGPADLALRSYADKDVLAGQLASVPLAVHNYGPAEPLPIAMLEVHAPPGTRVHRPVTLPDVPPCRFSERDTTMVCNLLTLWRGQTFRVGGSSPLITIAFEVLPEFAGQAEGWAEVRCSCDPYPGNNRVALVLNGDNPPLPSPGPGAPSSAKPSAKPSVTPRPSSAASPRASSAAASPTGAGGAEPAEPTLEPTSDQGIDVDVPAAAPGSSGPDLVLLAGIGIVVLALAGLGLAGYVWRRDRTQ